MSGTPTDSSLPEGASRRRWYAIGGATVLVVLVVAAIVWAVNDDDDDDGDDGPPAAATVDSASDTTADDAGDTGGDTAATGSTPADQSSDSSDGAPPSPPTTVTPTSGPPATAPEDAPPVGVEELPPVGVDEPAQFGTGLEIRVVDVERFEAEARQPGETAGPAIAVEIEAGNETDAPIDMIGFVVTASDPDGVPLIMNSTGPSDPFTGVLEPGEVRTGTYVFRVDDGVSAVLRIEDAISPEVVIVEL